ncbi:hypothetical protein BDP27DRAFT_1322235 [Rhodocollybia butyracea]|uniref:Novel STAND NTPase 1 domain-containing protein n=1 Tax=Rhodocollybia butyracea TaxID=206335 RepID=A0A9P5U9Y3_9AGAR|nr:hypothetical protein BDP27DRAFT_1322235 [Rhodocollybia butyracea]
MYWHKLLSQSILLNMRFTCVLSILKMLNQASARLIPSFATMTCFPCWPNSVSATPTSDDEIIPGNVTKPQKENVRNNNDDLGPPTKGEYARESGKMFLEVLDIAAKQIPVPGVVSVIEVVKSLVQMCDDSYTTLKNAKDLKNRIENLTLILIDKLKGKKAEEIEERLRSDIKQLECDLKHIQSRLGKIAKQNAFLVILFQGLNENKVQECVGRLGNALESFHLAREIADADAIERLSQQIITFYGRQAQAMNDMQEDVTHLRKDMTTVLGILDKRNQGDNLNGSRPRRGVIPVAPEIFFGRDAIVNDFVHTLVSQKTSVARICLLGPGGMGKTSIARTVLNHPSVIEHFGKESRVWVPCVKATSVSLLKDTLYESLGVSLNTGDPLRDILYDLESSTSPIILLLDNFETPWNLHSRTEVQDILSQLAKLQHVALFVTMRSFELPGDGIHWESVCLEAVDKEASICIYTQIDPAGNQSSELPLLLDEVGHMPLAITLMAKLGQQMEYSPAELLELYKDAGTALLNLGEESQRSMDICIGLSVESQLMIDSPGADKLLGILALLPIGTTSKALSQWWVHDMAKATIALRLRTLLDTSLVEKRADTYVVLPVIRRYVLDPNRFPKHIRESTVQMACAFLKEHNASVGTSNYLAHKDARSLEEANLQGILLETTAADPDIIEALLILSEHQVETRPRLEVVQHALELSKESEDQKWYAEALYWNGRNLRGLDQYEEAIKQFHLAREAFLQVLESKCAADALYWAGYSSSSTSNPNYGDVPKALAEFQSLGDTAGIAKCQIELVSQWDVQSILSLTATREFCISNNLLLEQFNCTWYLTQTCVNLGRFDEAKQWGLTALCEARQIGDETSDTSKLVGQIFIFLGDYDKAVEYLMKGLETSKAYGSPIGIVRILFQLGRAWMKKGREEDAQGAFTETLKYCELLQGSWECPRFQRACRFYLDKLENPSREPTSQERDDLEVLGAKEDYETAGIGTVVASSY